jgi:hypothetical protein
MTTIAMITPDALELMNILNGTMRELLETARVLKEELPPRAVEPALFTPEEAAAYLKVSIPTLAKWRMDGMVRKGIPAPGFIKLAEGRADKGSVLYEKAELDRWIREDAPKFGYRERAAA